MKINTRTDLLNYLIQRHDDLGELGLLYWSLGQMELGDEYFAKANEVWLEFNRLYEI